MLALGAVLAAAGLALFFRPVTADVRLGGSIECGYAALHSESAQSQDGAPLCDSPLRSATWAAAITTLVGTALLALGAALTPTHLTRGSALAVAALLSVAALVLAWQANR
jgi:hypothetical protein